MESYVSSLKKVFSKEMDKLPPSDMERIRVLASRGQTKANIASRFGVSTSTIDRVLSGQRTVSGRTAKVQTGLKRLDYDKIDRSARTALGTGRFKGVSINKSANKTRLALKAELDQWKGFKS